MTGVDQFKESTNRSSMSRDAKTFFSLDEASSRLSGCLSGFQLILSQGQGLQCRPFLFGFSY